MDNLFLFAQEIFKKQNFSTLLNSELTKFEPGTAEITLHIEEKHKQQHGFVHGGVLSYLADNCLTFAGGSVLGDSLTVEYKINYLKPAIGQKIVAQANVISSGKTQAVCECRIFAYNNGEEKLVAVSQGTIVAAKGK